MSFFTLCKKITKSFVFNLLVIVAIILSGIVVGLETFPNIVERHGQILHLAEHSILIIFIVEILIRILARGRHAWLFFLNSWNLFDLFVVIVCVLPIHAEFFIVVRLFRIFRVLRLVTFLPRLQILVGALFNSLSSIIYIAMLLFLQFYVYAAIGVMLFGHIDPLNFGNIAIAIMTMFEVLTLEGWIDIFSGIRESFPLIGPLYFVSFIVLGTMIVLNLFVGVILNAIEEQTEKIDMQQLIGKHHHGTLSLEDQVNLLALKTEEIREGLKIISARMHYDRMPYRALKVKSIKRFFIKLVR